MMGLFLLLLLGTGFALSEKCKSGEFEITGYYTGQNIDINQEGTRIHTVGGATQLTVAFYVPKTYTEQYEAAAFTISFNRKMTITDGSGNVHNSKVTAEVEAGDGAGGQSACFTNRYSNSTLCQSVDDTFWKPSDPDFNNGYFRQNDENECIDDMQVTVPWVDVMTNGYFGEHQIKQNGNFKEVFLLATVETWSHFTQTTDDPIKAPGAAGFYKGQMTGREQYGNAGGEKTREGIYTGDGGDLDVAFPALHMDDERYTLYQIPFILRFPMTVVVSDAFKIGSRATLLSGVVSQEVIQVNFNPDYKTKDTTFAVLDVVVTTEVQYPYAIRSEEDESPAKMTVVVGSTADGGGTHARSIEFMNWDDKSKCGGLSVGEMCQQKFRMRIIPSDDDPCSVAGDYTMEFWADCVAGLDTYDEASDEDSLPNLCTLDKLNWDSNLTTRRGKNGHFTITFNVQHQNFCPVVIDTVRVVSDIKAYHDEEFTDQVTDTNVFTNDILFYEATYRTATDKNGEAGAGFQNNNDGDGGDSFIDYVRATEIFATITIGEDKAGSTGTNQWTTGSNWKENVSWSLGGQRLAGEDFTDVPDLKVLAQEDCGDNSGMLSECNTSSTSIKYQIELCKHDLITADTIQTQKDKPVDCFSLPHWSADEHRGKLARDYLDFNKVDVGEHKLKNPTEDCSHDDNNCIDENEIAFKLRLDERIIPVGPKTDASSMKITVRAEVYYVGNRHPSRRLLQVDSSGSRRKKQEAVQTIVHAIRYRKHELKTCMVHKKAELAHIHLKMEFSNKLPPTVSEANQWAGSFGFQLESSMNLKRVIKVTRMETSTAVLLTELPETRRAEIADDEMFIELTIQSSKHATAGTIANEIQKSLKDGSLKNVNAFRNAVVTSMEVPECDAPKFFSKLASSASGIAYIMALAVTLFHLI